MKDCPFCNEKEVASDLVGLKIHLENFCDDYHELSLPKKPEPPIDCMCGILAVIATTGQQHCERCGGRL